jgi:outer membrane protein OmpA-like peptidoglycan-associated protein
MKTPLWLPPLAWIALTSPALGAPLRAPVQPPSTTNRGPERVHWVAPEPLPDFSNVRWWLFGGVDLGGTTYSSMDPSFEGARSGFVGGLRALISYDARDFVFDGGLGWQYITITGNNPATVVNGSNVPAAKVSIQSRVPYVDVSARYRLGSFQVGPEFEFWLGTDYGLNLNDQSGLTNNGKFLGLKAAYEWDGRRRYRLGGRWLTGLGVPSRTVNQFVAFFEMGFDVFGKSAPAEQAVMRPPPEQVAPSDFEPSGPVAPAAEPAPAEPLPMEEASPSPAPGEVTGFNEPAPDVMSTPAPPPETAPMEIPAPAVAPVGPERKLVLSMGYNDLPFGFNDTRLPPAHEARVKKIGAYLARHKKAWKTLLVSGHTDNRGSSKMNMDLSLRRAETVRRLLIEGGLSPARIRALGFGETKPMDRANNPKAWARNRRVELEFRQVNDAEVVKKALDQ